MMHMTFYWSKEVTLLFDSWKTKTWLSYILTLLVCIIAPIVYQFLEYHRVQLKLAATKSTLAESSERGALEEALISGSKTKKWSAKRVGGALLFGVNSGIGYMLMLAIMSFNGGVFLAVVIGLSIGYLLFRSDDDGEIKTLLDNPCACA